MGSKASLGFWDQNMQGRQTPNRETQSNTLVPERSPPPYPEEKEEKNKDREGTTHQGQTLNATNPKHPTLEPKGPEGFRRLRSFLKKAGGNLNLAD